MQMQTYRVPPNPHRTWGAFDLDLQTERANGSQRTEPERQTPRPYKAETERRVHRNPQTTRPLTRHH